MTDALGLIEQSELVKLEYPLIIGARCSIGIAVDQLAIEPLIGLVTKLSAKRILVRISYLSVLSVPTFPLILNLPVQPLRDVPGAFGSKVLSMKRDRLIFDKFGAVGADDACAPERFTKCRVAREEYVRRVVVVVVGTIMNVKREVFCRSRRKDMILCEGINVTLETLTRQCRK